MIFTAQKVKFSIKDFFSKCNQIRRNLYMYLLPYIISKEWTSKYFAYIIIWHKENFLALISSCIGLNISYIPKMVLASIPLTYDDKNQKIHLIFLGHENLLSIIWICTSCVFQLSKFDSRQSVVNQAPSKSENQKQPSEVLCKKRVQGTHFLVSVARGIFDQGIIETMTYKTTHIRI